MKIRQAKKIFFGAHWHRRLNELRPPYEDERGRFILPSWSDVPIPTWQKARRRYLRYLRKAKND